MIYTTGTIALSGNTLTGTGTNFTAAGSLIRNGCTVIALTSPAQVFQITAIGSATSLTVTPTANPAIPAGTKYAILLSDSLSVDGLAQDIAETFTMYQRYMSGFADVMNGTTDVTITINGVAVTVPGQKSLAKKGANSDITSLSGLTTALSISQGGTGAKNAADARTNLGLGTASILDAGSSNGQLMKVSGDGSGSFGVGALTPVNADGNQVGYGNYNFYRQSGATGNNYFGNWGVGLGMVYSSDGSASNTTKFNMFIRTDGEVHYNRVGNNVQTWRAIAKTTLNTTVDSNGFLKTASPVVKIFGSGKCETNLESEGCTVTRLAKGEYHVEGCQGLNSDAAWGGIDGGFDIPTDRNKQPLVWLDYEVNADGSVLVKTYHRTHPESPAFARNELQGINDGDPVDIPSDQFISVRVEMPENSVWNQSQKEAAEPAS
ncbi:phage tail protein [Enterobacter hormaechei subsp. xiangfangensis]|nr:phage tail protein [Enterobacter hormaechei subsp. xiangfangensis]